MPLLKPDTVALDTGDGQATGHGPPSSMRSYVGHWLRLAGAAVRSSGGILVRPAGGAVQRAHRRPRGDAGETWIESPPYSSAHAAAHAADHHAHHASAGVVRCAQPDCVEVLTAAAAAGLCCYEDKPVCSTRCLALLIEAAIHKTIVQQDPVVESYQHRMPLGLWMLSHRWINEQQLGAALASQRQAGSGRLGEWLVAAGATDETRVARAVAAQWGIPLLQSDEQSRAAMGLLPRLLVEAFAVVPMRIAADRILYLAIDQKVDPCLNLAIEKMTGLRVEPVAMAGRAFRRARQELLDTPQAPGRLFRARSLRSLQETILALAGEQRTRNVSLVRVHEYFWVRLERWPAASAMAASRLAVHIEDCILAGADSGVSPNLEN